MNLKGLVKLCAVAVVLGSVWSGKAVTINDPGVIGTIRPGIPSGADAQVEYVNSLIDLANTQGANKSASAGSPTQTYNTGALQGVPGGLEHVSKLDSWDSGSIPDNPPLATLIIPSGWDYVLAKFGGGQTGGGDVVWYLGGAGMTLPANSLGLGWVQPAKAALPGKKLNLNNSQTEPEETAFAISHFTLYNSHRNVPEAASTLGLIGVSIAGMALVRRKTT